MFIISTYMCLYMFENIIQRSNWKSNICWSWFLFFIWLGFKGQTVKGNGPVNPCRHFKFHFLNGLFQQVFPALINESKLNEPRSGETS